MEAPEVPLEQVHEDIHHAAGHGGHGSDASWTRYIGLSTALIAALAALAALCAGHTETEAMQAKMEANDQWSYYQAKSIKLNQLESTAQLLAAMGKEPDAKLGSKIARYEAEKASIEAEAEAYNHIAEAYLAAHTKYGFGVTMFQVAIALSAISALTRQRRYWLFSLGLGAIGICFGLYGVAIQQRVTATEQALEERKAERQGAPAAAEHAASGSGG